MIARLLGGMVDGVRAGTPSPWSDYWYGPVTGPTPSGVTVTPLVALQTAAVYSCIKVLSETLASLPWFTFERVTVNGMPGERAILDHPLFSILHDKPNNWQTSFQWRNMMMAHLCLRGNAYNQIVPGPRGAVQQLIPLHPDKMKVELLPTYELLYTYSPNSGPQVKYRQDEIFHVAWFSTDGITGDDPITLYKDTVGHQKAQEEHGATLFKNGGKPSVILRHPNNISEPAATRLSNSWVAAYSQSNAHKPAVLEEGMEVSELGMTNEASQWLESRKLSRSEICGIFRVPPHMISDLEKATFANIDKQDTFFAKHTMLPWVKNFEQAVQRDLLDDDHRFFSKLSLDGLQRGDIATRGEYYRNMMNIGTMSQNDIRRLENMNPIEGGDRYWMPLNMFDINSPRPDNTGRGTGTAAPEGRIESDSRVQTIGPIQAEDQHRISDDSGVSHGIGDDGGGIQFGDISKGSGKGDETLLQAVEQTQKETPLAVEQTQKETPLADRLAPIVSDVAHRIANAEATALARRAKHAKPGDKRFEVWAVDWLNTKGLTLTSGTIKPLLSVAGIDDGNSPMLAIADAGAKAIETSGDIAATVAGWSNTRTEELAAIITEEVTKCQTE